MTGVRERVGGASPMFEPVLRDIRESARRVSIHPLGGGQPIPHPARVSLVHPPFGVLAASISFRSIYTPIGKASVLGARRLQGPPCNIGIGTVPVCSRRWQSALNAGPRSVWRASSLTRGVPASADPCAAWLSRMWSGVTSPLWASLRPLRSGRSTHVLGGAGGAFPLGRFGGGRASNPTPSAPPSTRLATRSINTGGGGAKWV